MDYFQFSDDTAVEIVEVRWFLDWLWVRIPTASNQRSMDSRNLGAQQRKHITQSNNECSQAVVGKSRVSYMVHRNIYKAQLTWTPISPGMVADEEARKEVCDALITTASWLYRPER